MQCPEWYEMKIMTARIWGLGQGDSSWSTGNIGDLAWGLFLEKAAESKQVWLTLKWVIGVSFVIPHTLIVINSVAIWILLRTNPLNESQRALGSLNVCLRSGSFSFRCLAVVNCNLGWKTGHFLEDQRKTLNANLSPFTLRNWKWRLEGWKPESYKMRRDDRAQRLYFCTFLSTKATHDNEPFQNQIP